MLCDSDLGDQILEFYYISVFIDFQICATHIMFYKVFILKCRFSTSIITFQALYKFFKFHNQILYDYAKHILILSRSIHILILSDSLYI